MSQSGVYMIRCVATDRRYIGSSIAIPERWRKHRNDLIRGKHHSNYLQNAWSRYGADSFVFEVIVECRPEDVREVEQWWLDNTDCAYNIATDARGGRVPRKFTVRGRQMTLRQIADEYDIGYVAVRARAHAGLTGEDLIRPSVKAVSHGDRKMTMKELAAATNISLRTLISRAQAGDTGERLVRPPRRQGKRA